MPCAAQIFATFLFTFFTGTALSQAQAIIEDPTIIISLLGVAAPQQVSGLAGVKSGF